MIDVVQKAARYDPKLQPFYERIARKNCNQKVVVAVARKRMLVSIYHVLTWNEHYDGDRPDGRARKIKKWSGVDTQSIGPYAKREATRSLGKKESYIAARSLFLRTFLHNFAYSSGHYLFITSHSDGNSYGVFYPNEECILY